MKKKRLLLKISGASFKKDNSFFNIQFATNIVQQIIALIKRNYEIILVTGGGNICRGRDFIARFGTESQVPLDHIGMLSTVINGLFLKEVFKSKKIDAALMSAINVDNRIAFTYNWYHANKLLHKQKVLILTAGIGNPNFSTDFSALLKAKELNVELILIAKYDVDGVYTADPKKDPQAKFINKLSFSELVTKKLEIIDISAAAFNTNARIKLLIFNIHHPNAIMEVLEGRGKYTVVTDS